MRASASSNAAATSGLPVLNAWCPVPYSNCENEGGFALTEYGRVCSEVRPKLSGKLFCDEYGDDARWLGTVTMLACESSRFRTGS